MVSAPRILNADTFSKDASRKLLKLLYKRNFCNSNNKRTMNQLFLRETPVYTDWSEMSSHTIIIVFPFLLLTYYFYHILENLENDGYVAPLICMFRKVHKMSINVNLSIDSYRNIKNKKSSCFWHSFPACIFGNAFTKFRGQMPAVQTGQWCIFMGSPPPLRSQCCWATRSTRSSEHFWKQHHKGNGIWTIIANLNFD